MSRIRNKPANASGGSSGLTMGLIALVAVAVAIGLGYFIGKVLMGGGTPEQAAVVNAPAGATAVPGAEAVPVNPNPAATGAPIGQGAHPVSKEEQPIGASEPRLWVPEAAEQNWTFHLGDIPNDSKTEKEFTVENIGNATLVIEDVSASCGCTTSTIGEKELAPGATTILRVSYDPRVNGETGRFVQKQVRIKSNDPLVQLAEFTITADVAAE
ncbi:MAG TPA: DUF1573 domain-containing protein [Anaerolineae bacterium]|nr:DUF1573 domain-containing protein [Anaerolineae bacterium]